MFTGSSHVSVTYTHLAFTPLSSLCGTFLPDLPRKAPMRLRCVADADNNDVSFATFDRARFTAGSLAVDRCEATT